MGGEGQTVIVHGLPTDIDENRLTDKLYIHFMRKRHGGGDISSITLPKSMPGCALITFEDSEVVQRVIQYGKHIVSVGDKKYEVTVSLFNKVDPDEVFTCIAVTVDYSRLPQGKVAVSSLKQCFPDINFSFTEQEELCDIKGHYSEVQALISHLLNQGDVQPSAASRQLEGTKDKVDALSLKEKSSSAIKPVYHSKKTERQVQTENAGQALIQDLKSLGNSERSHYSEQALECSRVEEDGAGCLLDEAPLEDYFLVMDSDIYRYLQQHCGEQYQLILNKHRVEAVELCTQDITTVYLQAKPGNPAQEAGNLAQEVKRVQRVHEELGRLYQQKEAQLRKAQLPKEGITTEGLQRAFKALQQRLPKILLSDDMINIYIVGSGSDVSEAKQFFLDIQGTEGGSTLERAGFIRSLVANGRDSLYPPSTSASSTTDTVHTPPRKHKMEAGKEYKIATKFGEIGSETSGNNGVGFVMGDTTAHGDMDLLFGTSRKKLDSGYKLGGPVLGSGSLSVRENSLWDNGQNQTESDLLFGRSGPHYTSKEGEDLSDMAATSAVLSNKPMQFSNMQSTVQHKGKDLSDVAPTRAVLPNKPMQFGNMQSTVQHKGKDLSDVAPTSAVLPNKPMQFSNMQSTVQHKGKDLSDVAPTSAVLSNKPMQFSNMQSTVQHKGKDLSDVAPTSAVLPNKPMQFGNMQSTVQHEGKDLSDVAPTSAVLPNKPMQFSNMPSTMQHLSGNKVAQTAVITSSGLATQPKPRRVHSFSGHVKATLDLKDSTTPVGSQGKANRGRTSSFSNTSADTLEEYILEVVVPKSIWMYMKDCYYTQIEDLTSGINVSEYKSGSTFTLFLKGTDSPKIGLCHQELQNLISKVKTDFCTKELSLAKLGVTDLNDETLELSCIELEKHFENIKIVRMITSVFIMGPNQQCGQAVTKLMDIFCSGAQRKTEMGESLDGSAPTSTSLENIPQMAACNMRDLETASGHNLLKEDTTQTSGLISVDSQHYRRDTKMGRELESKSRRKDNSQGNYSSQKGKKHDSGAMREGKDQSAERKDPVFKPKLWSEGPTVLQNLGSDTSLTKLTAAGRRVNVLKDSGSTSLPNFAYTIEKAVVPNKDSNPEPHNITQDRRNPPGPDGLDGSEGEYAKGQGAAVSGKIPGRNKTRENDLYCLCGASGSSVSRMGCGNAYCPQCLCEHASCDACPKPEETRGIKGTMSFTEMCMNLPGHIKDTTLKLTYNIPDGIQGEDHPKPGAPFKGGVFEAFLPFNKHTNGLLPLLQRAFNEGLTFKVIEGHRGERVTWGSIPHKTKMNGGKSANGYPDSSYVKRLDEALKLLIIEEDRDAAKHRIKS